MKTVYCSSCPQSAAVLAFVVRLHGSSCYSIYICTLALAELASPVDLHVVRRTLDAKQQDPKLIKNVSNWVKLRVQSIVT
jgi:hypothetical protein